MMYLPADGAMEERGANSQESQKCVYIVYNNKNNKIKQQKSEDVCHNNEETLPEALYDDLASVDIDHPLAIDKASLFWCLREDLLLEECVHVHSRV